MLEMSVSDASNHRLHALFLEAFIHSDIRITDADKPPFP
jgi:hypothetical protein